MKKSSAFFSMILIVAVIAAVVLPKDSDSSIDKAVEILKISLLDDITYDEVYSGCDIPIELPFNADFGEEYDKRDFDVSLNPSVYSGYYSKPQRLFFDCTYDICYTLDGTIPDKNSLRYDDSEGILIDKNTFLCVSAINGGEYSNIGFFSYVILNDSTDYHYAYGYNSLEPSDKFLYERIYNAAVNFERKIDFGSRDITYSKLQKILLCVNYDNPLMFQLPLICLNWEGDASNVTGITLTYDFNPNEVGEYEKLTKQQVDNILAKADGSLSLVDYICIVHDEILLNCDYSLTMNEDYDYEAFGVLVKKSGVCESYARAFQYICQRIGVRNLLVVGECQGEGHMWNMINLDDEWYHMDLTWDDGETSDDIYYDYFNFNDRMLRMYGDRTISPMIDDTVVSRECFTDVNYYPIPLANGVNYTFNNYYYQFGFDE